MTGERFHYFLDWLLFSGLLCISIISAQSVKFHSHLVCLHFREMREEIYTILVKFMWLCVIKFYCLALCVFENLLQCTITGMPTANFLFVVVLSY